VSGLFIREVHVIEPVSDAGVGLPRIRKYIGKLALFDIEDADGVDLFPAVLLGVDGPVFAVNLDGFVVKVRDGFETFFI